MKKWAFIALNQPQTAKQALAAFIDQVKNLNPAPAIRYVKPDGLHLTLHFLGNLEPSQIEAVSALLEKAAAESPVAKLELTEIGGFPNLKEPRVLVINARQTNGNSLAELQQKIGEGLEQIGIATDSRKWTPHLTLARVNGRTRLSTAGLDVPKLTMPVNSIELMESRLTPHGAEYSIIKSSDLKRET